MKKKEALRHIRNSRGFIPYVGIFDIYEDDEEIPQELIDLSMKKEETTDFMVVSSEVADAFNELKETSIKEQRISPKMDEFLDKVDRLCFEYGYEIHPTIEGWTGKINENGKKDTIAIIGNNEVTEILYIDGDGRGK